MMNEGKLNVIKQKIKDIEEIVSSMAEEVWFSDFEHHKQRVDSFKQLQYILECFEDASNRVELIEWKMEKKEV